jgi:hypothetical protein
VGDRQEPLVQRRPAVEVLLDVRVLDRQVDVLLAVGRRVRVVHQRDVGRDAVGETQQLAVEVEPPPRVLATGDDQRPGREREQAAEAADDQQDGERQQRAQQGRAPVQLMVRVVDAEVERGGGHVPQIGDLRRSGHR